MFHKTASLLLVFAISASAATIAVDTSDRGYYSSDFSDSTNKNYLTGQLNFGTGTGYYHSSFAFVRDAPAESPPAMAVLTNVFGSCVNFLEVE